MRKGPEAQTKKAWVRVLAGLVVLVALASDARFIYGGIREFHELGQSWAFWAVVAGNQVLILLYIWLALPVCLLGRWWCTARELNHQRTPRPNTTSSTASSSNCQARLFGSPGVNAFPSRFILFG